MSNEELEKQLVHQRELIEGLNKRLELAEASFRPVSILELYKLHQEIMNLKLLLNHTNLKDILND